ncbi:MFS transporter [Amycolatopsis nigrescens]|uniref:MFS transporter n=1 Tax=Amycolatopsis nigrescens TaxID=381445 RepID=UPI0003697308|nr:MFS transporter [Amycolatopsis nigrescens]
MTTLAAQSSQSLFHHRPYWRWSAGVQLGRLPAAMAPLAFTVLTTAATGSYRLGGVMMAVFVLAELAGAIPAGRLLDRIGPAKGLALMLVTAAAALAGLAAVAATGASGPVLLAMVVLPGVVAGGMSGGFRTLLAGTISGPLLPRAIAVDAMILDGVLIAGPALVALLATAHSLVPLLVMALAYLLSAALVPRVTAAREQAPAGRVRVPARACAPWLACQFTVGHVLSTVEVAPLPLVQRLGEGEGAAALLIAVLCGASIGGGALYAWRGPKLGLGPRGQAGIALTGFVLGAVLVAANLGRPGLLCGVALIGVCTAPLVTIASVRMQALLPATRRSEGFSLSFAVQAAGFGLGSLTVGVLPLPLVSLLGASSAALGCAMLTFAAREVVGSAPASF